MPIIIRKQEVSPPSFNHYSDDEDDYVQDPEQIRDQLPQPYRMIDKVMNQVLDEIWDLIADRETSRMADAMRVRPPKYQCAIQMQVHGDSTCLCDSKDGRYVFAGLPNGLAAIDVSTNQVVYVWEEAGIEISQLDCVLIGVQTYLLSTIDDMGIARLFAFAGEHIYLVKIVNEQEGGQKVIASKCQPSSEGDYVALFLENPQSNEKWLEVYRNPRDNWLRELEGIQNQLLKDAATRHASSPQQDDTEAPQETTEGEQPAEVAPPAVQSPAMSPKPAHSPSGERVVHKFTPPTTVLKIKPPCDITPCPISNPASSAKLIDSGDVIGTGANHQLTSGHLDQRKAVFEHLNEPLMKLLPKEGKTNIVQANLHFLNGNKMLPIGLEQPAHADRPTSIAVWWNGGTQLMHYSLVKQTKDTKPTEKQGSVPIVQVQPPGVRPSGRSRENSPSVMSRASSRQDQTKKDGADRKSRPSRSPAARTVRDFKKTKMKQKMRNDSFGVRSPGSARGRKKSKAETLDEDAERKPDLVWPYSQPITATAVSPCTSIIAIGLANGIVVIWDIYMGLLRKIVKVCNDCRVKHLTFLNPNICPQPDNSDLPFTMETNCHLMVVGDNSAVSLLQCAMGDKSQPEEILPAVDTQNEELTLVQPLSGIPEIVLCAQRGGSILLKDIVKGHNLCQVVLPNTHSLTSPWQPVIAVGGEGLMLYIKGTQKDPNEDYVPNSGLESLFVFQLRSFPTLDRYWRRKREEVPYFVHSTVNDRVSAILKHRQHNQPERCRRLQKRWTELKEELQRIQEVKDANRLRLNMDSGFGSDAVGRT